MKGIIALSLAAAANGASIANLFLNQSPVLNLAQGLLSKPTAPLSTQKLAAQIDKSAIREKLLWGPFTVKAANASHAASTTQQFKLDPYSDLLSVSAVLCKDCMVLWAQGDIADREGKKLDLASGLYNHHTLATDFGRAMVIPPVEFICPDGKPGGFNFDMAGMGKGPGGMGGMGGHGSGGKHSKSKRQDLGKILGGLGLPALSPEAIDGLMKQALASFSVFLTQGDEGSANAFHGMGKFESGFFLGQKDKVNIMSEVINYENVAKEVYLSLEYEYVPKVENRAEWYDVGAGAITVEPCGTSSLFPPADAPKKYISPLWSVKADGYLIDIKPHLHDGGINMTFFVNGEQRCTSSAVYGGEGGTAIDGKKWETITAYTPCTEPVKITKGDNLTMEAWYDLTQHKLRPRSSDHGENAEGMALALFEYARPPQGKK